MQSNAAKVLFNHLKESKKAKSINGIYIIKNKLDDECMADVGELISKNSNIKTLSFGDYRGGNNITDNGVKTISKYLTDNQSLRLISFNSNKEVSNKSLPVLQDLLRKSKIDSINVRNTSFSAFNELLIAESINKILNGIKVIDLKSK